jgi:hypothetical protein
VFLVFPSFLPKVEQATSTSFVGSAHHAHHGAHVQIPHGDTHAGVGEGHHSQNHEEGGRDATFRAGNVLQVKFVDRDVLQWGACANNAHFWEQVLKYSY